MEFKDSSGKLLEQLVYTPNPISKLSKNESFSIQARLVYDNPTLYLLTFDGFTDQEEQVHFISKTENMAKSKQEANNMEIKVQKGFMIPYMPGIVNEDGGEATVYFKRTSGDSLRLNLKWGAKIMTSMM